MFAQSRDNADENFSADEGDFVREEAKESADSLKLQILEGQEAYEEPSFLPLQAPNSLPPIKQDLSMEIVMDDTMIKIIQHLPEEGVGQFDQAISKPLHQTIEKSVPTKMTVARCTHPWINASIRRAIKRKQSLPKGKRNKHVERS